VQHAAVEWLTEIVLREIRGGEPVSPAATTLLIRRYAATGRDDVRDAVSGALARALTEVASLGGDVASAWIGVLVEAAAMTDDDRLPEAVAALAGSLRQAWPGRDTVGEAMTSVDAVLKAADLLTPEAGEAAIVQSIDELERVVGRAYHPGEGIAHSLARPDEADGNLDDHVCAAMALMTAYGRTGRLPYPMLAEELLQFARRSWWDDRDGTFRVSTSADEAFRSRCEAARALCRIAALHDDDEYRRAAVIANAATYGLDAERALRALEPEYRRYGAEAAVYGLALDECAVRAPQPDRRVP
jgi:uncharacterized protein YyaL (SSP411 family)